MKVSLTISIEDHLVQEMERKCDEITCGACCSIDVIVDSVTAIITEKFNGGTVTVNDIKGVLT